MLSLTNLTKAVGNGANFSKAVLSGALLREATLGGADFPRRRSERRRSGARLSR